MRAPELVGRSWLNAEGDLRLADFRGRFVLLDFWTFCCINCLHVIEELRPLEERHSEHLSVIGVHSPKFAHEADPAALAAALERHRVHHRVLDDPDLATWQAYTARAWPTLVLIDPEGYVVAQYAGEGHVQAIDRLLDELVADHRARQTLQPGDAPWVAPAAAPGELRFPAAAVRLVDGRVLVADTGHDEVVELAAVDGPVVRRIGGFCGPNGLCLLPPDVAAEVGYDVVVADTVGHRLQGIRLASGDVVRLTGDAPAPPSGTVPGVAGRLSSPWDVVWWRERVWIAMAGVHQLWTFDPRTGAVEVAAGTANEGLVDGPARQAWFAQTSGFAVSADGRRLWLVDAETSSLRWVEEAGGELMVRTAVGTGLFDFGFRDGTGASALLQHPLAVTALPDGSVAVADTYNAAIRRYDPAADRLTTIATGLSEPSGAFLDSGALVVVETNAHRLTRASLGTVRDPDGFAHTTGRPVAEVGAVLEVTVSFTPPPGQRIDDRFGPAAQLSVSATPPALLREGEGRGPALERRLVLDPAVGDGVLHIAARAASCDVVDGASAEGAACHVVQQDWGVPVRITPDGPPSLRLPLGGT